MPNVKQTSRSIHWIGPSLKEVRAMPVAVRRSFGYTLFALERGEPPTDDISRLKGHPGVFEIRKTCGDTFRLIYLLADRHSLFVLAGFKKKSHTGSELPRELAKLIETRLAAARSASAHGTRHEQR